MHPHAAQLCKAAMQIIGGILHKLSYCLQGKRFLQMLLQIGKRPYDKLLFFIHVVTS